MYKASALQKEPSSPLEETSEKEAQFGSCFCHPKHQSSVSRYYEERLWNVLWGAKAWIIRLTLYGKYMELHNSAQRKLMGV